MSEGDACEIDTVFFELINCEYEEAQYIEHASVLKHLSTVIDDLSRIKSKNTQIRMDKY